ncbi:response regulator [Pseudorhodoferax sp. Leaf267]|uniref:response regulator n=1 Tax=Pseudorhodoferax sp. Leaf267 TaxID=1736316 RepID=UPI0006FDEB5D|nr:response regulator [Pseudorhodoferax sp. Leaf267]KQP13190.1 two-component system response regulator [Pseudorhodoferax sp. Leaf267]
MKPRILIVEDNAANLELARYLLSYAGYDVLLATDGEEGLAVAARELPHLIISDLQMPVMDGYSLIAALRASAQCAHIPVVALTAFSMPGDREDVMRAGFLGYLSKPIEPELFVHQVATFLASETPLGARAPEPMPRESH